MPFQLTHHTFNVSEYVALRRGGGVQLKGYPWVLDSFNYYLEFKKERKIKIKATFIQLLNMKLMQVRNCTMYEIKKYLV